MQLCCYHNISCMDVQNIDDVAALQEQLRHQQLADLRVAIQDIEANLGQIETMLRVLNPNLVHVTDLLYLIDVNHPRPHSQVGATDPTDTQLADASRSVASISEIRSAVGQRSSGTSQTGAMYSVLQSDGQADVD